MTAPLLQLYAPERIDRFIELCRDKRIDLLITEGTRLPADPSAAVAAR